VVELRERTHVDYFIVGIKKAVSDRTNNLPAWPSVV